MAGLAKRGQIWTANLNPGFGVEIHKTRPVLIVSSDILNKSSRSIIIIPLSTQVMPLGPEKVFIPRGDSGLDKDSASLAPLIRSVDQKRLVKHIGNLKSAQLSEIEESLKLVLGMIKL